MNSTKNDPVSDKLLNQILEKRNAHLAGERELGNSYDKWLLTLSGGALALSLNLARDIASPKAAAFGVWFLGLAWLLLVAAVVLGLASIYTGQKAHEAFRQAIDKTWEDTTSLNVADFWKRLRTAEGRSMLPLRIDRCNLGSLACFVLGTICLCVFACVNVWYEGST